MSRLQQRLRKLIRRKYVELLVSATLGALFSFVLNDVLTRWGSLEFKWVVVMTIFTGLCTTALIYSTTISLRLQKRVNVAAKRNIALTEKLNANEREHERRLDESEAQRAQLAKQLDDMPDKFCALMGHNREFLRHIWEILALRELDADRNEGVGERGSAVWRRLDESYHALLECICNTAANVIDCRKEGGEASCVNLKLIAPVKQLWPEYSDSFGSEEVAYRVVRRSANAPSSRDQDDKRINAESVLISRNYLYQQIMQKIESGDPPKEWYLLVDDMEEELAAIKKVRRRYSEPQDNVLDMYRSCLIVPVTNMAATKQVIGFICVDSRRKGAFNTGYDLQFLQEFADNAAIATCLYFGALQSKGRRLKTEKEALTS